MIAKKYGCTPVALHNWIERNKISRVEDLGYYAGLIGLKSLKKNGIRFFVGTKEFDLFSPQDALFLGMAMEMNEFFSQEQAYKSLLNRINR